MGGAGQLAVFTGSRLGSGNKTLVIEPLLKIVVTHNKSNFNRALIYLSTSGSVC